MGNDTVKTRGNLRSAEHYAPDKKSYRGCIEGIADGWCTPQDAAHYKELASEVHNGTIIEVGAYEGLSLYHIKDICAANNSKLYCVDFIAWDRLIENCLTWGIEYTIKPSVEAALDFPDEFFDLIYIDADHHKSECMWDIWAWLPKLKKTGTLAGHDYDGKNVRRALYSIFGHYEEEEAIFREKGESNFFNVHGGSAIWHIKKPHDKVILTPDKAKYSK